MDLFTYLIYLIWVILTYFVCTIFVSLLCFVYRVAHLIADNLLLTSNWEFRFSTEFLIPSCREDFWIFLVSSPGLLAAIAASYCPSRPGELTKKIQKTSMHDGMGNSVYEATRWATLYMNNSIQNLQNLHSRLFTVSVLVLVFVVYNRRREAQIKYPNPDDDVRENIINYEDEGGGEDDMTAFDITPLQIPVAAPDATAASIAAMSTLQRQKMKNCE